MPEYLAPGVFVEEVSYRSKSIEGVATTTTGFVGPTRYGPVSGNLEVITSLADFERTYGDGEYLVYDGPLKSPNFVWYATKAFFDQGGSRLYVKRVFHAGPAGDGHAHASLGTTAASGVAVRARFPGAAGNGTVSFTLNLGPSLLSSDAKGNPVLNGVQEQDVVFIRNVAYSPPASPPASPPGPLAETDGYYVAARSTDPTSGGWVFTPATGAVDALKLSALRADADPKLSDDVRVLSLSISVTSSVDGAIPVTWTGLPLDPAHATAGARDSAFAIFADSPPSQALARTIPVALHPGTGVASGLGLLDAIDATGAAQASSARSVKAQAWNPSATAADRTVTVMLTGGDDGARPGTPEYAGDATNVDDKQGLKALEDIDDISIVAAPGVTWRYESNAAWRPNSAGIMQELIGHAERMRYRIAVLESADGEGVGDVAALRGTMDSTHAALYYPWITIVDPVTRAELNVPPAGFVCGIYARNDIERSVVKAPANEVVTGAIGFETLINRAQQEVLNPLGVNCFRFFEGRGLRLWGARTISSDPEWKYVNLRRYFAFLEHSIDRGTQWAVFEPNGERLWANVTKTISDFLFSEFQNGAFLGTKPEEAYFVKCDRSTMSQNDIDNGRLVCQIGVAVLRPAEFVIFRIGQWTADRKA